MIIMVGFYWKDKLSLPRLFTWNFHSASFFLSLVGPECSQNYTMPSGVIKSPGFPEKYPNSLECTYIIFAPKMSEIILEFESFDLEPDSNPPGGVFCRYDRLEIWDGFPDGKHGTEHPKGEGSRGRAPGSFYKYHIHASL